MITRQGVLADEDEASADRVFVCCQLEKYRDKNMLFTEEELMKDHCLAATRYWKSAARSVVRLDILMVFHRLKMSSQN